MRTSWGAELLLVCNATRFVYRFNQSVLRTSLDWPILQNEEAVEAAGQNKTFAFMKAYALYKLDRLTEAWNTLNVVPAGSVDEDSLAHLKAQVLYRQMQYAGAADQYVSLMKSLEGSDEADVWDTQLNLLASLVSAGRSDEVMTSTFLANAVQHVLDGTSVEKSMPFELIYNVACALLDAGRPAAAATALEVALVSGSALLAEEHGSPPEEVAEEMAPLRAQAAMILQQAGYEDAAESLYESMGVTLSGGTRRHLLGGGKGGGADPSTRTVAISNLAGLQSNGRKLVEGYARIAAALDASTTSKLTRRQLLTLRFNRALLAFHLKRFTEVDSLLAGLRADIPAAKAASVQTEAGMPAYLTRLQDSVDALQVALDAAKAVAAGSPEAGSVEKVANMLKGVVLGQKGRRNYVSPALACYSQLLSAQGQNADAATVLLQHSSAPVHPCLSMTCAQLCGPTADGLKHLTAAVDTWTAAAAAKATGSAALAHSAHAVLCAVQALQARAAALASAGMWEESARDLTTIARKLPGATAQQKAAALAMLALVKIKQSGGSAEKETTALLEEARTVAGGAVVSAGASAVLASTLEWVVPGVQHQRAVKRSAATGTSSSRPSGVAPPFGATAVPAVAVDAAAAAAKAAASAKKAEKRRRIARAKRAKRRTAYLAKLSASEKYAMIGIPRPDPERWIPKVERSKGKRKGKDAKGGAGYGHQGGGDAALAAALDAKAKAEKEKASGAPAPAPAPAPKGKPTAKGKGRK